MLHTKYTLPILLVRCIATLDMNKLILQKYYRSFYFEVSWISVLVMTFKKLLIWKMPWFLYLHLSRHITTVIGRLCGHYLFLVMQKLGQQSWTLEYASIMWNKDIYLNRKYNQWWKPSMGRYIEYVHLKFLIKAKSYNLWSIMVKELSYYQCKAFEYILMSFSYSKKRGLCLFLLLALRCFGLL